VGKTLAIGFALLIQLGGFAGAHFYYAANPQDVLLVVDSSFGLSGYQNQIDDWIDNYQASQRYKRIAYATDKTYLGRGEANRDRLYRVSFGKLNSDTLNSNYPARDYDERILLTFTGVKPDGWQVVELNLNP
jgi:hypothetical protein